MSEFITLTCPSCGGTLEVTSEIEQLVCQYCGKKHIIRRSGSAIFLDGLAQVLTGVDRTGSELAIVRLKEEIPIVQRLARTSRCRSLTFGTAVPKDDKLICVEFAAKSLLP